MNEWIKRTGKKVATLGALLVLTACIALPIIHAVTELAEPTATAQLSTSTDRRSPNVSTLLVAPPKNSAVTTNVFQVNDSTGTNWFGISKTNVNTILRTGGIIYTGVTGSFQLSNGIFTAASLSGVRTNLYFKNGLLVDGP